MWPLSRRNCVSLAVMSILLYGCTTWTLTKRLEKKLDGNYTRMLRAILNKSWQQHPTRHQLYGHLPPITKTIQVRRTRHAGHCWRSRDELIRDVLLWIPTYGRAKAGRPARTYIQQLCEDTGCCPEDLPRAMNDREEWRERVRDIRATSAIWWWWNVGKRMMSKQIYKYYIAIIDTIFNCVETIAVLIIIIILFHQHRYPCPFLDTPPYRSSLPAGPQCYTPYSHRAAVCRFELVVLLFLGHVKGSIGVHHWWARTLLLQQCLACLVRLIWTVFVMGGWWPYSCRFVGVAFTTCSILLAAFLCSCR